MTTTHTIALDAMGGDRAPEVVVAGANQARLRYPNVNFRLFGDPERLEKLKAADRWSEGDNILGMPKVRVQKLALKKKKKVKKEEEAVDDKKGKKK